MSDFPFVPSVNVFGIDGIKGQFGSGSGTDLYGGVITNDYAILQALDAFKQGYDSNNGTLVSGLPYFEDFNTVLHLLSAQLHYLQRAGIQEYSSTVKYNRFAYVRKPNTKDIYISLVSENIGHPLTDTAYWQYDSRFSGSYNDLTNKPTSFSGLTSVNANIFSVNNGVFAEIPTSGILPTPINDTTYLAPNGYQTGATIDELTAITPPIGNARPRITLQMAGSGYQITIKDRVSNADGQIYLNNGEECILKNSRDSLVLEWGGPSHGVWEERGRTIHDGDIIYTSTNYNYVKYTNGLLFQQGYYPSPMTGTTDIILPLSFVDANYHPTITGIDTTQNYQGIVVSPNNKTASGFRVYSDSAIDGFNYTAIGRWK